MAFVIDRFWLPLLLAAIIGFMVAWATCGRSRQSWLSSWLPLGILAAIAGVFAAVQVLLPGMAGLWLETGLLMFASYLGGCCLACMARRLLFGREPAAATVAFGNSGAGIGAAAVPAVAADAHDGAVARKAASEDSSLSAMVAASGAGIVAAATSLAAEPAKASKPEEKSGVTARPADPVRAAEIVATPAQTAEVGALPLLLASPRDGKKDDLTLIWGVAEKLEERMNKMGIWHFDQIAAWTDKHVAWFEHEVEGFKGRLERDKWIEQCGKLAKGWRPDNKVGARPKS